MILVDTNVLIDLMIASDTPQSRWSRMTRASLGASDPFYCNVVILAEIAGRARSPEGLLGILEKLEVGMIEFSPEAAFQAGQAFREYRRRGGPREAILADFLIGGHAAALGAALMTRDRKLTGYFPTLRLITPDCE